MSLFCFSVLNEPTTKLLILIILPPRLDATIAIHLMDANAILTVPESLLPTIQDPSTNRLADHLGSLYIEGNTNYDVGLSSTITSSFAMHAISRPSSPREHNQLQERVVGLTR